MEKIEPLTRMHMKPLSGNFMHGSGEKNLEFGRALSIRMHQRDDKSLSGLLTFALSLRPYKPMLQPIIETLQETVKAKRRDGTQTNVALSKRLPFDVAFEAINLRSLAVS